MPTDNNRIATEHPAVEVEHTTSNEQSQSWHEDNVLPERQAAEAMRVLRELQGSICIGGRQFTRREMSER